ncbi:hypothetical protein Mapa_001813 [Marchantia paleacea]|nr:hypothetical protein Mapa_001813 [Marchantia paleacea]
MRRRRSAEDLRFRITTHTSPREIECISKELTRLEASRWGRRGAQAIRTTRWLREQERKGTEEG